MLNKYFDKIYCINLDRATERWEKCVEQFNKYGIEVERFSAIEPEEGVNGLLRGEIGIMRTNYEIIKQAKKLNLNNILILEDDFEFVENFNTLFEKIFPMVPEDWDFLYFGGNHVGGFIMINEYIARMKHSYAIHTFAVKNTMFEKILNTLPEEKKQVDVYYADMMANCNAYVLRPHLSYQKTGFSYINNTNVTYEFLKK